MNFLSVVLSSAEEAQLMNIKQKLPQIKTHIGKLKSEVRTYMENAYVEFKTMKQINYALVEEAKKLNDDMLELKEHIDNVTRREISTAKEEIKKLSVDAEEATYALKIASQLVYIHESLRKQRQLKKKKQFFEAAKELSLAKKYISELPEDEQIEIVKAISVQINVERETLLNEVMVLWDKFIVPHKQEKDDEIQISLKIKKCDSDEFKNCLKVLSFETSDNKSLNTLSNFTLNELLCPIIYNMVNVSICQEDEYSIFKLSYSNSSQKMPYKTVFDNIHKMFDFLITINFELHNDTYLMGYMGSQISKKFCDILIKDCVADVIASAPDEFEVYSEVKSSIELLRNLLTECQFISNDDNYLTEYANNVDATYVSRKCQIFLVKAREIMKKDLHEMIEVGTDSCASKHKLDYFPKCCISQNATQLITLATSILEQAATSSEMCAEQLYGTAKQIFEIYVVFVPHHHKKLLENIPQQVALFHNNCMYISFELGVLSENFKGKLSKLITDNVLFIPEVQHLKVAGKAAILKNMQTQIKLIEEILKNSELSNLGSTDRMNPNLEKSIRQCLRQMELLKTVWQNVLSYDLYNKSMGDLLSALVNYLVNIVVSVEDISADNCNILIELFELIQTRGPKLFSEPKDINSFVKQWQKFNGLLLVFKSNLADIDENWADGKGPLARILTPEEMSNLIRAIFQNTDKRANVLSRIY